MVVICCCTSEILRLDRPEMFAKAHRLDHPFSSIIRIRLILDIIFSKADVCGALNLRAMT